MANEEFVIPYNTEYALDRIDHNAIGKLSSKNYEMIKILASYGLNKSQIATALKISNTKLTELIKNDPKFEEAYNEGLTKLHTVILVSQLRMALPDPENGYDGNATMLKHLGNVHLGQAEKVEVKEEKNIHVKLTWGAGILPKENSENVIEQKGDDKVD